MQVVGERSVEFHFYSCGTIPPPVVMVQDVRDPIQSKNCGLSFILEKSFGLGPEIPKFKKMSKNE